MVLESPIIDKALTQLVHARRSLPPLPVQFDAGTAMPTSPRHFGLPLLVAAAIVCGTTGTGQASERDREFFEALAGEWSGPGEIVSGKYKGTKFVCNFKGAPPGETVGMSLDGRCRVGMFTQNMSANIALDGRDYTGTFMDGAEGKGLDVVGGDVSDSKVVFALNRNDLNGAMLAHLSEPDSMTITVSVRVEEELIPVIGVNLKRTDGRSVGSID